MGMASIIGSGINGNLTNLANSTLRAAVAWLLLLEVELMETVATLGGHLQEATESEMASIIGSGINGNKKNSQVKIAPHLVIMASIIGSGINGN